MSPSPFSPLIYRQPLNRVNNSQNQRFLHKQPIDFNLIDSILLPHHRLKLFILISGDSDYLKKFYSRHADEMLCLFSASEWRYFVDYKEAPPFKNDCADFFLCRRFCGIGIGVDWIGVQKSG